MGLYKRKITVQDDTITSAVHLTLRQSLLPIALVAVAAYFINFCEEAGHDSATSSDLPAVAQGLYAAMRFIASGLMTMKAFKPRYMLTAYLVLCVVFSVAAMNTHGTVSIVMIILVLSFESLCFATIFPLALRGPGRHTKLDGSMLVAAISGGMVFPPMMGAVVTRVNDHTAMAIPMMGYILALIFPIYVNIYQKDTMDLHRNTEVNVTVKVGKELALEEGHIGKSTETKVETVEEKN